MNRVVKLEISKKKRNKIFYYLGIPYQFGKNVSELTIHLGKTFDNEMYMQGRKLGERTYDLGEVIANSLDEIKILVIDKSEDQFNNNNKNNKSKIPKISKT